MGMMVRMPRTDTLVPASDGRVSWGLAWRVCAFLPIVLLCVGLTLRAVGGSSDAAPEAAAEDTTASSSSTTGKAPILTTAHRSQKQKVAKSAKSPSSEPTSTTPSTESAPESEDPTRTSSPSPSPSNTPSPTPTPDEAREQCLAEGRTLAELAECIANKMGG